MRGAAMSLTAAVSGLVVFLLSVSVVQGQDVWGVTYSSTEICAVKGSTVEINCSYTYPSTWRGGVNTVEKTFWFIEKKDDEPIELFPDSEYAGRVETLCGNNICTLRIRNLRESDSAQYRFRFTTNQDAFTAEPGVTLSVTDLTMLFEPKYTNKVELKCESSCRVPSGHYVWYSNGEKTRTGKSSARLFHLGDTERFSCALKGYEDFPSPAVYAPKLPSVSVSPSAEIEEGSSVTLTCSSDANPAAQYTWYKEGGNQKPPLLTKAPQLVLSSIQVSDSGVYYCTAESVLGKTSNIISIDVKYAPKLPSVSVSPSAEIEEGSSVTLTCSSDANPAANYTWYKEYQTLPLGAEGSHHFPSISSEDRGNYYCKTENQYGEIISTSLPVDVQYAPKLPSVSVRPSAEIEEGSSVTLTCSSDANPAANYIWYKKAPNAHFSHVNEGPILVFSSIHSSDSGQYNCTAENKLGKRSTNISIDVKYAPKLPSVSVSPSAEIEEGSSVTLTCSSDANPAANYTWYKENEDSPNASGQIFTITDFRAEHSGSYSCEAQNKLGRSNSTLYLSVGTGSSRMMVNIIRTTLGVLILMPVFLLSLWMRKEKSLRSSTGAHTPEEIELDSVPEYENVSLTAAQTEDPEEQEDMV
ncbi:myelin-associated glycoprotein-like isoform X2 [Eleginops maclovinus]